MTPTTRLPQTCVFCLLAFCLIFPNLLLGQPATPEAPAKDDPPTFEQRIAGLQLRDGLFPMHLDAEAGKVFFELPAPGEDGQVAELLYAEGLVAGLGSNPVGFDRGQISSAVILRLRHVGGKLLIEQPNLRFRASSDNALEQQAVRESFAPSVLWAGPIEARAEDGRLLVDVTSFLLRDAHGISRKLKAGGHGNYALDAGRSVVDFDHLLAFPDNLELDVVLTYGLQGGEPGVHVRQTVPDSNSFTLVQHHSFVRLPDADGFRPRAWHPRSGASDVRYSDYSAPLADSIERRLVIRHRLSKDEPIIFYLDPGTPEPVRSALFEGASWWTEAFKAAGFPNGYRVEMLPADVHPLDVRYNVIQWVHRSTRGWSYGGGVVDPRTGEMVKGHVNLGSLRVRQDRLLFEGLVGADATGQGGPNDPIEAALARIRQLAAHEVGHALGLDHNFAASTYGRGSVLDYPAPLVKITADGDFDLSEAYGVGLGAWDVQAVRYSYTAFDSEDEAAGLAKILAENQQRGLLFVADQDARPAYAAHPLGSLWDNGSDTVAELEHALRVRRLALDRFGADRIAEGQPLSLLQEVLAPVYFHHRYQLAATAKSLGGLDFRYTLRGDDLPPAKPVDPAQQRRALALLLRTLDPVELDLSDDVLALLLPRPANFNPNRELFNGHTTPVFDPLAAAATATELTLHELLQPQRAARLVDFHRRDANLPGFEEVLEELLHTLFPDGAHDDGQSSSSHQHAPLTPRLQEIQRTIQVVATHHLIHLADDATAAPAVRARAEQALSEILERLGRVAAFGAVDEAHRATLSGVIERFFERLPTATVAPPTALPAPPGSPIGGQASEEWLPEGWGACSQAW